MSAQSWDRDTEVDPWADVEPRPYRDGCPQCIARVNMPWCGALGDAAVSLAYRCRCGHQWWTTWALEEERLLPALLFDSRGMPFDQLRLILDLITRRMTAGVSVSGVSPTGTEDG